MRISNTGYLATAWILVFCGPAARADGINWSHDLNGAKASAKQSNHLVMVDFYTDWCGWCKKLDSDVYTNDQVINTMARVYPVKLNGEKDGLQAAQTYRVTAYPAILFLDGDGNLVGKILGFRTADKFAVQVQQIMADNAEFPQLETNVQNNPGDTASAIKLINAYINRDRPDDAARVAGTIKEQNGSLINSIAASFAAAGKTDTAIAWYNKNVNGPTNTLDLMNAHYGLYKVYAGLHDTAAMKNELLSILQVPGAPETFKVRVRAMLAKLG